MRARGEVDDRDRAVEHARERLVGRLLERSERDRVRDVAAVLAHDRPHLAPRLAQPGGERAADEAPGPRDRYGPRAAHSHFQPCLR